VLVAATSLRIALAPVVMALACLTGGDTSRRRRRRPLFALAAGTDFLDGYFARRWGVHQQARVVSSTPPADKLLVTVVLLAWAPSIAPPPWLAAVIVGRELTILGLRGVAAADGTVFPPSPGGKAKAAAQFHRDLPRHPPARRQDRAGLSGPVGDADRCSANVVTGADYLPAVRGALRRGG
jgi:phosphatidylglycerophosphate synthase